MGRLPRYVLPFALPCALLVSTLGFAHELSFISGGVRNEEVEDVYKRNRFGAGGRYSMLFSDNMYWLFEAGITFTSYSGDIKPDDHTGIRFGGGMRYYFDRINPSLVPFAAGMASFVDQEEERVYYSADSVTVDRTRGLMHELRAGLRLNLNTNWFLDLEAPLFRGGLFGKTTSYTATKVRGENRTVKTDTSRSFTDLYTGTAGALTDVVLSLGMRL